MFAPHCPTCGHRVLLGTRRIVDFVWTRDGARRIVVRCFCGALLDALRSSPDRTALDELPTSA